MKNRGHERDFVIDRLHSGGVITNYYCTSSCGHCLYFCSPKWKKEYIETGKVKYVFMDFPLESIHPKALKAHEAGNCSGDQGKYWEMHERIFENNRALALKDLKGHAETIGLNLEEFQECMDSGKHESEIRKDLAEGKKAGVRGTPTFFDSQPTR